MARLSAPRRFEAYWYAICIITGVGLGAWVVSRLAEARARAAFAAAVPAEVREWCRVRELISSGKPSERIVEAARTGQADVIVMGVRGRGAIDLMAFGSTTNDVIRRAACPVLAVHPSAADRRRPGAAPAAAPV